MWVSSYRSLRPNFPGVLTPQSDWLARSTAPGVVRAVNFPSASNVNAFRYTNGVGYDPSPSPGSVGSFVNWNASDGIFGNGCLQTQQMTTQNMNSVWWLPFDPSLSGSNLGQENAGSIGFAAGQTFYIQFRVKFTQAGVNNTTGGGGRKFFSVSRTIQTDTDQEIVSADLNYRGVYMAYQGYGEYNSGGGWVLDNPLLSPEPGADFNLEPGSTYASPGQWCSYQQVNAGNKANCWLLQNNVWMTFQAIVTPSHYQTTDGHYTMQSWLPGMSDYATVMDIPSLAMQYGEDGVHTGIDNFNAMVLWIYDTGSNGVTTPTVQSYDQIIVSTNPIPVPQIGL